MLNCKRLIFTIIAACISTVVSATNEKNINIVVEKNESEPHEFRQLSVYVKNDTLYLMGKLHTRLNRRSLPSGHVDIQVIDEDGQMVDDFAVNYRGRFYKKSRPKGAPFYAPLSIGEDFKGDIIVSYHKNEVKNAKWHH